MYVYAVNKKRVSCRKQGVSWTKMAGFFFQVFLILVSFITVCSESQISVFKQCQSNTQMSGFFWGGGGSMRRSQNLDSEKKTS